MPVATLPPITGTIDEVRAFLQAVKAAKSDPQRADRLSTLDIERGEAGLSAIKYLSGLLAQHPIVAWDNIGLNDHDDFDMAGRLVRFCRQREVFNHVLDVAIKLENALATGEPLHVTDQQPQSPHEVRMWSRLLNDVEKEIIMRLHHSPHVLASESLLRDWWATNDVYTVQGYVVKAKLPDNLDAIMGV